MIRRALRTWAGGLPATFWTLWVGTLINRIGSFVTPFLGLYLTTERGLSVAAAGGLVAATGAGSVLSQPLGGALADRVGPAVLGREPRVQRGGRRRRPAAAHGYGLLFAIDALTCTAYAAVVWRRIPETRPLVAHHAAAPGGRAWLPSSRRRRCAAATPARTG
ncbi:MAG: hypothetical protein QOF86_330 [Baekduia sp.]|nr:hypothetical protein [Baekduia sp.]